MQVELQVAAPVVDFAATESIVTWAEQALCMAAEQRWTSIGCDIAQLCIRLVDADEGRSLNQAYRGKREATNVLSFGADRAASIALDNAVLLGDIVLCAPVVAREANEQNKRLEDHCAHLVIHGVLHLLGYDHKNPDEAVEMESKEVAVLQRLGVADPYVPTH